ncbi:MAG TPA: hypothetical protein VN894_09590 [Polyangiaceae bacterium]|nr:hypothetical protein [Polyangiaceae bacterium]
MTVGELRKALEGVPDDLPVEATYDCGYHANGIDSVTVVEAGKGPPPGFDRRCLVIEVNS